MQQHEQAGNACMSAYAGHTNSFRSAYLLPVHSPILLSCLPGISTIPQGVRTWLTKASCQLQGQQKRMVTPMQTAMGRLKQSPTLSQRARRNG